MNQNTKLHAVISTLWNTFIQSEIRKKDHGKQNWLACWNDVTLDIRFLKNDQEYYQVGEQIIFDTKSVVKNRC